MELQFDTSWTNIVIATLIAFLLFGIIFICVFKNKSKYRLSSNIKCITHYNGTPILIINTKTECIEALNTFLSFKPKFVGYDCEWKANRVRGEATNKISLIQIAHKELILLIRIHLFADEIPIELISFLQLVDIIKCGCGINGDIKKLKKDYNLDIFGAVELNAINTIQFDTNPNSKKSTIGLEKFCKNILSQPMRYKHSINHDLWENETLSQDQCYYAADDAYVAYLIFEEIIHTQYDSTQDIMEICFGKIDQHLFNACTKSKYKLKKSKCKSKCGKKQVVTPKNSNIKANRYLKSNKTHGMINCLKQNGELLSLIHTKTAKLFLRKRWAKKLNLFTIQMLFDASPINPEHDSLFKYIRILSMTDYCCVICGISPDLSDDDSLILIWHSLLPRMHNVFPKSCDDPYRVLLCKNCDKLATKIKFEFQHKLTKHAFAKDEEELKYINDLYKTRNTCRNLKHRKKRYTFTVEQQNEFVQEILKYCKVENYQDIHIKECDWNEELGIDWYHNHVDINYIIIRECIQKVCQERDKNRVKHNAKLKQSLGDFWKNRKIEFAEKWRVNFMKKAKPKFVNLQHETIEINVDKCLDQQKVIIERISKHKIISKDGILLTRTTLPFSERLCGNMYNDGDTWTNQQKKEQKSDGDAAIRIGGKTVQLLNKIESVNVYESDTDEQKVEMCACIVWVPFMGIQCFNCQCLYHDIGTLRIFEILPDGYYENIKKKYDGDMDRKFQMQSYVLLCVECETNAQRVQREFELRLFQKHGLLTSSNKDEVVRNYAFRLSQQTERFTMDIKQQNMFAEKILNHFGINACEEGIFIEESHCNKEMNIDWFYIDNYNYIIIKECISKLIASINKDDNYMHELCQIYKNKELEFIKLFVDNFLENMTIKSIPSPFMIKTKMFEPAVKAGKGNRNKEKKSNTCNEQEEKEEEDDDDDDNEDDGPKKLKDGTILCECGSKMQRMKMKDVYNGETIYCDECDKEIKRQKQDVYHCPDQDEHYYDLCIRCALQIKMPFYL